MPNGSTGYPSTMVTYRVNEVAVKHARKLIDAGTYDDTTEWSDAAPSARPTPTRSPPLSPALRPRSWAASSR